MVVKGNPINLPSHIHVNSELTIEIVRYDFSDGSSMRCHGGHVSERSFELDEAQIWDDPDERARLQKGFDMLGDNDKDNGDLV